MEPIKLYQTNESEELAEGPPQAELYSVSGFEFSENPIFESIPDDLPIDWSEELAEEGEQDEYLERERLILSDAFTTPNFLSPRLVGN